LNLAVVEPWIDHPINALVLRMLNNSKDERRKIKDKGKKRREA
jgi:hypothetical protein